MYRITQRPGGHVYQQIFIWAEKPTFPTIHHHYLPHLPHRPDHLSPPLSTPLAPCVWYRLLSLGIKLETPPTIPPIPFTLGWSRCQPCDLFRTHIHMYIPAGQDRTPSGPHEFTHHLSGITLSMSATLSNLSLSVCNQRVHVFVCGGMSLALRATTTWVIFFPGGESVEVKGHKPSAPWTTTTDPLTADTSCTLTACSCG